MGKKVNEANAGDEVYVDLLINIDGAAESNRIATFTMPIRRRLDGEGGSASGRVEFETKVLVRAIQEAVGKLV